MATASPDLIAPDELADMMESPDFAALPAHERAVMFDAGLEESRAWLKTNAGDDEQMSKAFDETANAMAVRYRPAESDIHMSQAEAQKPFFRLGDAASGVVDAVSGLTTTLPAAYYRLSEGFQRPDKYSPSARAAFDEEAAYAKQMQDESAARLMRGESSSTGDAFRSVGPSLGFSGATMAAAIVGGQLGKVGGSAIGGVIGTPIAGVGAAPGAAIGNVVGGVGGGMAAAGAAAYRMAGAQFLDDAFQAWLAKNPKADEAAREDAYQQLLPLAQNSALWEAGPEAVGTVVGLGAGRVVLGLGKQTLTKLAKSALGKAGIKAGALAAGVGTELATETATQVGQGLPQAQAQKFAAGEDMGQAKNPYDVPGGTMQAFKDVAPQTLALSGLMLGAGGAVKGAASLRGNPTDQTSPATMPANGQAVSPLGDIAAGTFQSRPGTTDAEPGSSASSVPAPVAEVPVQRAAILREVPDAAVAPNSGTPIIEDAPVLSAAESSGPVPVQDSGTVVPQVGDVVSYEGYDGRLQQDGQRLVVEVPNGPVVEVADPAGVQPAAYDRAAQVRMAELQTMPDPQVSETQFSPAGDGTLSLKDSSGNTYVPHNDQLLRSVRTNEAGGIEVLLRNPKRPGQVIKLTGKQAEQAQEAILSAAINVEDQGGKVRYGTSQGFQNLQSRKRSNAGSTTLPDAAIDALVNMAQSAVRAGKKFTAWSAEMVKRFGETIREYLAHVWAVAKDNLPTTAAQNVRLGSAAKGGPVRLNPAGAVINPLPSLKGGTKVFHAKGEPFRVNYLGMRELLTGSPLPAELVPVLTRTNQEKRSLEQRAAQLGKDLQAAIDGYVDKSGLAPEKVNEQVSAMMGGDVQAGALLSAVAPVLHERTRTVRVLLDNLSAAVGQTLPAGDLKTTITGNLGAWLRRSYAAFDPASGWNYDALLRAAAAGTQVNGRDAKKILDKARAYLRAQNSQATGQQIEADLRDLMDRDVWERELTGGGAKKSTSSLMRRKEIAPEIRAVMGEEQNPVMLLTSSAGFQAQFIARHYGQVAMRNAGLATGLFATDRGGVYTEQLPVNDRAWSGFNGVWTTPQMLKALDNASGVIKEGSDLGGLIVSTLKTLGNKAKLNRVALNPDSWMVNMLGNLTSLIQNGDVFAWNILSRVQKAREITGAGDAKSPAVVNAAAEALQDASRDMQARLTEAGVLGTSLTLADLEASLPRHLLQWLALDNKADKAAGALEGLIVGQAMGRGLGVPGRAVGGAIGAAAGALAGGTKIQAWQMKLADFLMTKPDALARVTGWMTNYETGLASGMAPDAAATWASARTLNTFPNYAALPGVMREASKLGIMGSFIAFQYEVYRNFGWNVRYAAEELSSGNPALIGRGLQRVAGIGAVASLAGGGLAAMLAATGVAGSDDERNKLFRKWFGAPWEKDAVLAFREFDAEKVSYFNTSYILPQTTMAELMQALREGENPSDAARRVVDRLYEQFVGGSVHLGPLLGAAMNQKRSGAPITYRDGAAGVADRLDEPLKTILEPGFAEKIERLTYALRQAERNGTLYSIDQEFRRVIGLREQTKTWPKMVESVYRELAKENTNLRMQANKEVSLNRPGASKRAVEAANAGLDALRQKVADFERDALKLGVPDYVLGRAKREASVGKIPRVGLQADGKRVISLGQ